MLGREGKGLEMRRTVEEDGGNRKVLKTGNVRKSRTTWLADRGRTLAA
jgi:hypothetical protein